MNEQNDRTRKAETDRERQTTPEEICGEWMSRREMARFVGMNPDSDLTDHELALRVRIAKNNAGML